MMASLNPLYGTNGESELLEKKCPQNWKAKSERFFFVSFIIEKLNFKILQEHGVTPKQGQNYPLLVPLVSLNPIFQSVSLIWR